jgi:ATP-dependent exoDNAse (exonuclease V) beta subunit
MGEHGVPRPAGVDCDTISQVLVEFLARGDVATLFARIAGRSVLREQEYADNHGRLFRMDRVLIDERIVTVVDFKTGGDDAEESYRTQLSTYAAILRDIYPDRMVRSILAYIDLGRVKEMK